MLKANDIVITCEEIIANLPAGVTLHFLDCTHEKMLVEFKKDNVIFCITRCQPKDQFITKLLKYKAK